MARKHRSRAERREWIESLLRQRDEKGLTYRQLAARSGVAQATLAGWSWRLRKRRLETAAAGRIRRHQPGFVELVPPSSEPREGDDRYEVVLRSGHRLLVGSNFSEPILFRLVRALESC